MSGRRYGGDNHERERALAAAGCSFAILVLGASCIGAIAWLCKPELFR